MWNKNDIPSARENLIRAIELAEKDGATSTADELKKYLEALPLEEEDMTLRPVNVYMETWLYQEIPALDHGHVVITDYMGDEAAIVESARISYGNIGAREVTKGDINLLRYLMRHRHTSPFESCELKVKMKLPIFVARQLIRHRTASVNEYSARYSELLDEFYIPDDANLQPQSVTNKQGRAGTLTPDQKHLIRAFLEYESLRSFNTYQILLGKKRTGNSAIDPIDLGDNMRDASVESLGGALLNDPEYIGIARELARLGLTLNTYTQWIWKIDLHNLLHFIGLRSDAHAQYEIRVYSDILRDIVKGWMPNVYDAFMDYHPNMNAVLLSGPEWDVIRKQLQGEIFSEDITNGSRISNREWNELLDKINRN
jgi:thymidylate synthase (FAD)